MKKTVDSRRDYLRGRAPFLTKNPYSLEDLLLYLGENLAEASEGAREGSGVALFKCRPEDPFYAIVRYSWGSCSHCCAFEACDTLQDYRDLLDDYVDSAVIFGSLEEVLAHVTNRDWCRLNCLWDEVGKEFEKECAKLVDL